MILSPFSLSCLKPEKDSLKGPLGYVAEKNVLYSYFFIFLYISAVYAF